MKLMRSNYNVLICLMLMTLVSGILFGEVKAQTPAKDCHDGRSFQSAIVGCNLAIKQNPNNAVLYFWRGIEFAHEGYNDRAIADYNEAIRLDPKMKTAYSSRAIEWYIIKDYERAIADLNQAIRLDPQFANAYFNRGLVYEAKGNLSQGLTDYRNALRLNPKDTDSYNGIKRIENKIDAKRVR